MVGLFVSNSIEISEKFRIYFIDILEKEIDKNVLCFSKDTILARYADLISSLSKNLQRAESRLGYIFEEGFDPDAENRKTIEVLDSLSDARGDPVTLYSMAILSIEKFGISSEQEELVFPVLAAAVLGEVENDLPYHNNWHFRKVMLHMMRLISTHNRIFESKKRVLDVKSVCKLLAAAPIHDLGHNGENNYIDGKYEFARLEQKSFGFASPILKAMGASEEFLSDLRVMLMTSDVLPFGDPVSPANQMAAVFDYHFGMSEEDLPELSPELAILEERQDLAMLCMFLHAADLMNSMGLNYEITKRESLAINKEVGKNKTTPEDIWLFLNKICQNVFMMDAAQVLVERPIREIYQQVRDDVSASVTSFND